MMLETESAYRENYESNKFFVTAIIVAEKNAPASLRAAVIDGRLIPNASIMSIYMVHA
jgi:hypothetical protein